MSGSSRFLAFLGAAALAGCGTSLPSGGQKQVVSGQVALTSFAAPVDTARVLQAGKVVASRPVAADGTFRLEIPVGKGYSIEFAGANGATGLVFPRSTGQIQTRFDIRAAGAAFDLGTIRRVGDARGQAFRFLKGAPAPAAGDASQDGDNVQCEDGIDPTTGAVCVDDAQDETAKTCTATTAGESEGEPAKGPDGDSVDCENGIDPKTGAECDGGPAANAGTDEKGQEGAATEAAGEEAGGKDGDSVDCENGIDPKTGAECDGGPAANSGAEAGTTETDLPADAAVADHNLPAEVGCPEDGDSTDCQDGLDPVTGKECDGGPAANAGGQE